jgi:hypothetical protein
MVPMRSVPVAFFFGSSAVAPGWCVGTEEGQGHRVCAWRRSVLPSGLVRSDEP